MQSGWHSRKRKLMYEESDSDSEYDVSDDSTISSYSVDYQDDYQDNEVGERTDFQEFEYEAVKSGMWIIVIYEEEKWLGRVLEIRGGQVRVQCLEKPFGVTGPQKLESGHEAIFHFKFIKRM